MHKKCWVDSTVHLHNVLGRLYSAYTECAGSSLQCIYRTCLVVSTVHIQNVLGRLYSAYTERAGWSLQCIYRTCWVDSTVLYTGTGVDWDQARTQDFSQGGARFRAKREKKIFAPPWNCFVQKVK